MPGHTRKRRSGRISRLTVPQGAAGSLLSKKGPGLVALSERDGRLELERTIRSKRSPRLGSPPSASRRLCLRKAAFTILPRADLRAWLERGGGGPVLPAPGTGLQELH